MGMDMESCQVPKDPGTALFDKGLGRVQCLAEAKYYFELCVSTKSSVIIRGTLNFY